MNLQRASFLLVRRLSIAVGVLTLLLFAAIQPYTAHAATENPAFVRIIHASPDIGIVDVFVDGKKILGNFQFGTVTDYVPLPNGSHTLQIALLGKGVNASVVTQTVAVDEGVPYTIAALGTNATGFSLTTFSDNNLVAGIGAKVRIYHLSKASGTVSVQASSDTIVSGLSYPQASSYVNIPAGAYTFNLTGSPQYIAKPLSTTLKPWTVTSVFAIGPTNGSSELQFVSAQLTGMPGMPQTGSDPGPASPLLPWLPAALLLIGSGMFIGRYRLKQVQQEREI